MADGAVIFDVDGVLLELTAAEEDAFFHPFETLHGLTNLSRDWDSYRIRNDENIISEILEGHFSRPPSRDERHKLVQFYIKHLEEQIATGAVNPVAIAGARKLLSELRARNLKLGIATANLLDAARLRLQATGLWPHVCNYAAGADGGGHKKEALTRAISLTGLPQDRIVYLGDNVNDVEAGQANGVHFIGFSTQETKRQRMKGAGATHLAATHAQSVELILEFLGL